MSKATVNIEGAIFTGLSAAATGGNGGVFYMSYSNANVQSSTFTSITTVGSGGIFYLSNSAAVVTSVTFNGVSCETSGGILYLVSSSNTTVTGSTFNDITSTLRQLNGGVIYLT